MPNVGAGQVREARVAIGFKTQADPVTSNIVGDLFSFVKLNDTLVNIELVTENDAKWIGKGNEFASQQFNSNWNATVSVEKYSTSQFLAHCAVFGLGTQNGLVSPYVCTPQDPVATGIDQKVFTYVEAIRQGTATFIVDRASVGMVVEEFTVTLGSGPGLNNSRVTAQYVGTGKYIEPSTLTLPVLSTENILPGGGMTLTVNGVDYIASKGIVSVEFSWKNNTRLDTGFYPGSGFQTAGDGSTGQIRGRMEHGDREFAFRYVARFQHGSPELAALRAQTSGAIALSIVGATGHAFALSVPIQKFKSAVVGNSEGIVTLAVECTPLYDGTNPIITMTATTTLAAIGT